MTYTDTQLKQALAKMLPEQVWFMPHHTSLAWVNGFVVSDTELLHLVQLARKSKGVMSKLSCDSTWQEQIIELL